jgi:hypothetical protein
MLAHDTAALCERPRPQRENKRQHEVDGTFYLRRLVAIGLERTMINRIPMLDWPADLFADTNGGIAA